MEYREYLEKIVKEAEAIGRTVVDATKETADKAKAKVEIMKAEMERDKAFTSFGRIMYQIEKGTLKRDDSIIAAACKRIQDQEAIIEELNKKNAESQKETKTEECKEEKTEEVKTEDVIEASCTEVTEDAE